MQRTNNFNLIVVEGSDTVNLLTQMNPNTEVIDEQLFKNQNAGVQTATELLNGTVHAITRSVPDASMIRFTAVSRFTAGDTFTVDGVQVSALLPSGEQLPDGAFIIGSEVLCVLKGTLLTVFASGGTVSIARDAEKLGGQLPAYYATKTEVDNVKNTANSAGELAETNRQSINKINNNLLHYKDVTVGFSVAYNSKANTYAGLYNVTTDTDLNGKHIVSITTMALSSSKDVIPSYQPNESSGIIYFTTNIDCDITSITVRILYAD